MTKVMYICRSAKKKVVTCFSFYFYLKAIFCKGVFWAFRNKGSSKTRLNKSRENLLSTQKSRKYLLTYVTFFFFFTAPLDICLDPTGIPPPAAQGHSGSTSGVTATTGSWQVQPTNPVL
jgi:hypothetical protein